MWGPGSIPYAIGVFVLLYAWLTEDGNARRPPRRVVVSGEHR